MKTTATLTGERACKVTAAAINFTLSQTLVIWSIGSLKSFFARGEGDGYLFPPHKQHFLFGWINRLNESSFVVSSDAVKSHPHGTRF
jgi:hypothetical protein